MSRAPSYFEHVEGRPQLDVIEWPDPEAITVIEHNPSEEELQRIRERLEREGRL